MPTDNKHVLRSQRVRHQTKLALKELVTAPKVPKGIICMGALDYRQAKVFVQTAAVQGRSSWTALGCCGVPVHVNKQGLMLIVSPLVPKRAPWLTRKKRLARPTS